MAEGKDYFRLGAISTSKDGKLLAYSVDDNGSERFTARIKDLATGEHLPDEIPGTLSGLSWVAGDKAIVYSLANEQWRTDNARLHWLGQPIDQDVELFHEDDEGFRVSAALSAAEDWLIIGTGDHETSEAWLVPADAPLTPPRLVKARHEGRRIRRRRETHRDGRRAVRAHQRHARELPPRHRTARQAGRLGRPWSKAPTSST